MVEVPDAIIAGIVAFGIGFLGLYIFYKLRTVEQKNQTPDRQQLERLDYYEQQIIQLRIRMDTLLLEEKKDRDMPEIRHKTKQKIEPVPEPKPDDNLKETSQDEEIDVIVKEPSKESDNKIDQNQTELNSTTSKVSADDAEKKPSDNRMPNLDKDDITFRILELITSGNVTSHDIQKDLGKSREHVSRLMTQLYKKKYLVRTKVRPFKYTMSPKGKKLFKTLKKTNKIKKD